MSVPRPPRRSAAPADASGPRWLPVAYVAFGLIALVASGLLALRGSSAPGSGGAVAASVSADRGGTGSSVPSTTGPPATLPVSTSPAATSVPLPPGSIDRVTLVGDGVADTLAPALADVAAGQGIELIARTGPGCGVVTNSLPATAEGAEVPWARVCEAGIAEVRDAAVRDGSDLVLVLSTWESGHRLVGAEHLPPGSAGWELSIRDGYRQAFDELGAEGARVVVLGEAPLVDGVDRSTDPTIRSWHQELSRVQREMAVELGLGWVDLTPIVCGAVPGTCAPERMGLRPRPVDGLHFSDEGAAGVAPDVVAAVLAAVT